MRGSEGAIRLMRFEYYTCSGGIIFFGSIDNNMKADIHVYKTLQYL